MRGCHHPGLIQFFAKIVSVFSQCSSPMKANIFKIVSDLSTICDYYDTLFASVKLYKMFTYLNADSSWDSAFLYIFADDF